MNLLDRLAQLYPDSSKRTLRNWVKWGRVLVDGKKPKGHTVTEEQTVEVAKKESFVLYIDRSIIVIDKPAGLLSVPDESGRTSALEQLKAQYRTVYPVHRLDQGASGILLFARSLDAKRKLSQMFRDHDLTRHYIAIVEGKVAQQQGSWSFPLEELETYDVIVSPEGRESTTHFERLNTTARFSTLKITLETGRKHQIRVHCREVGHPIVGDVRYDSTMNPIKRLALHALTLSFKHPITGKPMHFESKLPPSMRSLSGLAEKSELC